MADRKKLTVEQLEEIVEAKASTALGGWTGELASDRAELLKRYHGEPYGDEVEGRSQIISRDISDAVDWIMPSLMRIFLSTPDFCSFSPTAQGDEKQAKLETAYVNNILMKENDGFVVLHDAIKDSLLLRNGYIKYWVDQPKKTERETLKGLTEIELMQVMTQLDASGDEYEIEGHEERDGPEGRVFDIKVKRTRKETAKFMVEAVPPEELRVSNRARGPVQKADFVQHLPPMTRSDLVEMGLSRDFVDSLPQTTNPALLNSSESIERDTVTDENNLNTGEHSDNIDPSQQYVDYAETYLYVDFDGDGIAELRKVVMCGGKIPQAGDIDSDNDDVTEEDFNGEFDYIPFVSATPKRVPHRHVGISIGDDLADLARLKTTLLRLTMDNSYLLTNIEWLVNERVMLSDFMTTRPGGLKRVLDKMPVDGAAKQVERQPILQHVLPVLDYVDGMKSDRSGVNKNITGLDPDTLKWVTADAAEKALAQANAKIEMIARMIAETCLKDLAKGLRTLAVRYRDHARDEMIRGEWQKVNPSTWINDRQVTVQVGIGTGTLEELRSNLMLLAGIQEKAAAAGIVAPENAYALAERLSDNLGFHEKGVFFTDPESERGKQLAQQQAEAAQKNPLADVAQVQGQWRLQLEQQKAQGEIQAANIKAMVEENKRQSQEHIAQLNAAIKLFGEQLQALTQMGIAERKDVGSVNEPKTGE